MRRRRRLTAMRAGWQPLIASDRRPVKPTGLCVREDAAGLRSFVLPGEPGVIIYIEATDKHVHAASCEDVDCGSP